MIIVSIYIRKLNSRIMYVFIYVDDILLAAKNYDELEEVKSKLMSEFKSKDLGKLEYFLGIKILHNPNTLFLSSE